MEIFPGVSTARINGIFRSSSRRRFMMEAVSHGVGRESAHHVVKEHATAAARALRTGETSENDLVARLAADPRLGSDARDARHALRRGRAATASAVEQVRSTVAALRAAAASYPAAATYRPGEIL